MVTSVQATFVLATLVHIRNISVPDFDETLKIPTVMLTFVQATFVLVTFVHIGSISAVADTILTKLLRQGQLQQNNLNIIGF